MKIIQTFLQLWADKSAFGITGLPIFQEITVALGILLASSFCLYFFTNYFKSEKVRSIKKHVPIPAIILTKYQERQIRNLILPESRIEQELSHPLLVFVNTKSGGQTGDLLLYRLKNLLNENQVYDLIKDKGPEKGLEAFKKLTFRVLVCGGDGSISWVLSALEERNIKCPVAVLPLGTGNDLARVMGWNSSSNAFGLVNFLCSVAKAKTVKLDRWNVNIKSSEKAYKAKLYELQNNQDNIDYVKPSHSMILSGYFGMGVDAQICLNFHLKRENQPHLFTSQIINKLWYASSGANEILKQRFLDFSSKVDVICDGKLIRVPLGIEGLIVFNIRSYGGGVDLWGDIDPEFKQTSFSKTRRKSFNSSNLASLSLPEVDNIGLGIKSYSEYFTLSDTEQSAYTISQDFQESLFDDGLLEVVGVQSSFELAASQVGLAKPTKLCQGKHIIIHVKDLEKIPIQVDGEPFILQEESNFTTRFQEKKLNKVIEITHRGQVNMLTLRKELSRSKRNQQQLKLESFVQVVEKAVANNKISDHQAKYLLRQMGKRTVTM